MPRPNKMKMIADLRKMGATKVIMEGLTVEFVPPEIQMTQEERTDAQLKQEIEELREELMDAEEVGAEKLQAERKKKKQKLTYAHS